jgi:mono/diheme cytochrome c family protein
MPSQPRRTPNDPRRSTRSTKRPALRALVVCGWLPLSGLAAGLDLSTLPPPAARTVDFVRDIQPLFAQHCVSCHGEKKQEADLRLDAKSRAFQGSVNGPVLAPSDSAKSRLIHLVAEVEPGEFMPRKGPRLTAAQIGLLRAWIDQGANWPDGVDAVRLSDPRAHWAFRPPQPIAPPPVRNQAWPKNAIDQFVLARLEREGLSPSPEASRTTLTRRLSLDLTGLPPTPEQIDGFLADDSAEAYDRLVERLLSSKHYGEKWGRHWLDAARYADTNGYEKDVARTIWPYRDWVIQALNADLPFDQFALEQLAGDLLPDATPDQIIATGFLRNSMFNEEGGVDPEQFRVDSIVDRVDTIGKTFLGLSIACGQCHNHKYDPLSQREYYRFYAFLNNDNEPDFEVLTAEQQQRRDDIAAKIRALEGEALGGDPGLPARMAAWEAAHPPRGDAWTVLDPADWHGQPGIKFDKMSDSSLIALAHNPGDATYVATFQPPMTGITAFRLETIPHPNQRCGGPGRSDSGNFVLSELTITIATHRDDDGSSNVVAIARASADYEQPGFPVSGAIDGTTTNRLGWAIDRGPAFRGLRHEAVFELRQPLTVPTNRVLRFKLEQKYGATHTLGRYRLAATTAATPPLADPISADVRTLLTIPPGERSAAQRLQVFSHYRGSDTNLAALNRAIDDLYKQWPTGPRTLVLADRREDPRPARVLKRGDFKRPGDHVEPGTFAVLHPMPSNAPPNRLGMARWLVDPANPLTPRVIVNRVWQAYFGHGLVLTPEDFGTRADPPSHPELLDWLACAFRDSGWSLKQLHRLIVRSSTYRQSSAVTPVLFEQDPANRLLARASRFRIEAELIRDVALSAAGLLSAKVGGPSVFPPIPDGVLSLSFGSGGYQKWETSSGEDRYRRGLYTFWKRTTPYPSLSVFDAPNADCACVRRVKSNTPLQALTTLNDTVFHEAAQALALRVYRHGGPDTQSRATFAFRLCTGRHPEAGELQRLTQFVEAQQRALENETAAAVRVASPNPTNPPPHVNLHNVAAWTLAARVLLNLDETLTRE